MSKAALSKEAKKALDAGEFAKAIDKCEKVLAIDADNYNAHVLLGLAKQKLGSFDESEKHYRTAITKNKDQPQAWQGLANLYEVTKKLDQYIEAVKTLVVILRDSDQRARCGLAMNNMLKLVKQQGNPTQIKKVYQFILPGSPAFDYLEGLVPRPVFVYQELAQIAEKEEEERINKEIAARRFRLGAKQTQVSLEVQREVYLKSPLEGLYKNIIDWAEDEETRRKYDVKLLEHGYKKMVAFPAEHKEEMRLKVHDWAQGLVILKYPYDRAWRIVLEWTDLEELGGYDVNVLREYIEFFPKSGLTQVLWAFLRSTLSPFPPPEEEEEEKPKEEAEKELSDDPLAASFLEGLERSPTSPLAHRIVASFLLLSGEYESAVEVARKGLALLANEKAKSGLKLQKNVDAISVILATALIHYQSPKHHPESRALFEDVLIRNSTYSTALVGLGLILEEQGDYDGALALLQKALDRDQENIRIKSEVAWCKILMEDYEEGLVSLNECLETLTGVDALSRDLRAQILWRIGTGIWNSDLEGRSDRKGAYSYFISALQQNQNFAPAYTSLGVFFQDIAGDIGRANKCFQKAFELSAGEVEAAERLARSFADSKEWELVEIVARRVAEADKKRSVPGKGASWPQAAIGVVELNNQNFPLAIQAFQAALRIAPNDFNAWVGLGEAYTNSGRFTAALKVFTQARKLNADDWFAKYMLANVHKDLGDYDEATTGYQEVLKIRGNEFGVLIALCETLVSASFHFIAKGYSKDAAEYASQIFDVALRVAEERPDAFNLWKAVGDACLALSWTKLNAGEFPVATVKRLLDMQIDRKELDIMSEVDDVTGSTLDHLAELDAGSRPVFAAILTFKRGIYASADDRHAHAVAWFNLGVAEHRAYISEPGNESRYRQAAIHCFKRAIKLEPGNADFWNALGVVTSEVSARVAQHALVRSLYINDKNVHAWVNLGSLYLLQKDYDLAREAFSRAQSVDPDYPQAWVGQGLSILLRDPEHTVSHEIMELFEHAFRISDNYTVVVHRQFANSSFDQLLKTTNEAAFTSLLEPLFALEKLHQKLGDNSPLLRLSSLFSERARAFSEASTKLETVCDIVEKSYEETESETELVKYAEAKADLARMYLGQRRYEEAAEAANMALDLSGELENVKKCRLSAHLTAGLAFYYLGQMEESLEMFKTALVESEENPDVIVLLSQVLWAKAGEAEREVAREQLLACIEGAPDHLPTLLSMATIGILDDNPDIIEAVVEDLKAVQGDDLSPATRAQVDRLLNAVSLTQPAELPLAATQTSIFVQPWNQANWRSLSKNGDSSYAADIALQVALNSSDTDPKNLAEALAGVGKVSCDLRAILVAPWVEDGWRGLRADIEV